MRNKLSEKVKTALILLLSVTAVFLLTYASVQQFAPDSSGKPYERAEEERLDWLGLSIAYYNGSERIGGVYLAENVRSCLSAGRELLERALATAGDPLECGDAVWRLALAGRSLYLSFNGALPAEVVWDAFGCERAPLGGELSALLLCPSEEEGEVTLLVRTGEGICLSLPTAARAELLSSFAPEHYAAVRLAAELGAPYTDRLAADALLSDETGIHTLSVSAAYSFAPEDFYTQSQILSAFGVNPYTDSGYTDAAKNRVYQGQTGTLSISAEGNLRFHSENSGIPLSVEGKSELVCAVRGAQALLSSVMGEGNEAYARLAHVTRDGDSITVLFSHAVGGIPLWKDGVPVESSVTVRDGLVVDAGLSLSRWRQTEDAYDGVLTAREAYVLYCSSGETAPLLLLYDQSSTRGVPRWVVVQ